MIRDLEERFGPSAAGVNIELALEWLKLEPTEYNYQTSPFMGTLLCVLALFLALSAVNYWHLTGIQIWVAFVVVCFVIVGPIAMTIEWARHRLAHRRWAREMRRIMGH
jgi:hypothetical protein